MPQLSSDPTQPGKDLERWRQEAFRNAVSISSLFATAFHIDPEMCISDPLVAKCAHDAAAIILQQREYDLTAAKGGQGWKPYLRPCAEILQSPSKFYPAVRLVHEAIIQAIRSDNPSYQEFTKMYVFPRALLKRCPKLTFTKVILCFTVSLICR